MPHNILARPNPYLLLVISPPEVPGQIEQKMESKRISPEYHFNGTAVLSPNQKRGSPQGHGQDDIMDRSRRTRMLMNKGSGRVYVNTVILLFRLYG